jgi:hypothetical protein
MIGLRRSIPELSCETDPVTTCTYTGIKDEKDFES